VRQAFSNKEVSLHAQDYLQILHDNMKDAAQAQRRSISLSLLVVVIFELISRAAIVDVQVGPVKVTKLSIIQEALPVVFSYFIYDICVYNVRFRYTRQIFYEVIGVLQEPLRSTELDRLLVPKASSLFGPATIRIPNRESYWPLTLFTMALRIGYSITPVLILAYMLNRIHTAYGFGDLLPWITAAFSVGFFIFALLVYVDGQRRLELPFRT